MKSFEQLCTLIDEFWQGQTYDKPGPKPDHFEDYYLKLYFFKHCSKSRTKVRLLERARLMMPAVFKKNLLNRQFYDACRI